MSDSDLLLRSITPEIYQNLKTAVELGKWADGTIVTKDQVESCMQAVIFYESHHISENKRTGYMPPKSECASKNTPSQGVDSPKPIQWKE